LIAYADSAKPGPAELFMDFPDASRTTRAPHPPYSPDLALLDFFLFEDVKKNLSAYSFDDAGDLLGAVQEILDCFENLLSSRFLTNG
jgi:hypothetical protein